MCEQSLKLWKHKAVALRMATRNYIPNPKRKPSISYSCSLDVVALVLQKICENLNLKIISTELVTQNS